MKLVILFLMIFFMYSNAFTVLADQQTVKDDGETTAKSLIDGVKNLSQTSDETQIPGYGGTNLPEKSYYNNQDIGGLETDAVIGINTGTVGDAAQFGYDAASMPKLQFPVTDPILLNSDSISGDAVINPEVLTVPTGDCAVQDVTNTETRLEQCTAWKTPTDHTCNKIRNVNVTWDETSSCGAFGTIYDQASTNLSPSGSVQVSIHARAVCNYNLPAGGNQIELFYYPNFIGGWASAIVYESVSQVIHIIGARHARTYGSCDTTGQCNYQIEVGTLNSSGNFVRQYSPIWTYSFKKAKLVSNPVVSETLDNQCSHLEAQLP